MTIVRRLKSRVYRSRVVQVCFAQSDYLECASPTSPSIYWQCDSSHAIHKYLRDKYIPFEDTLVSQWVHFPHLRPG